MGRFRYVAYLMAYGPVQVCGLPGGVAGGLVQVCGLPGGVWAGSGMWPT